MTAAGVTGTRLGNVIYWVCSRLAALWLLVGLVVILSLKLDAPRCCDPVPDGAVTAWLLVLALLVGFAARFTSRGRHLGGGEAPGERATATEWPHAAYASSGRDEHGAHPPAPPVSGEQNLTRSFGLDVAISSMDKRKALQILFGIAVLLLVASLNWPWLSDIVKPPAKEEASRRTPVPLQTGGGTSVIVKAEASRRTLVPLQTEGGTFKVPVTINGTVTLNFTIDSGAADVSIPSDVVTTLMRTGTLSRSDFQGERTYRLAIGSAEHSRTFRIASLKVGDKVFGNVLGSVVSEKGGLLLGQSFLRPLKSWSIDNRRQVLVLE
jgi:predicted aspartyl protease